MYSAITMPTKAPIISNGMNNLPAFVKKAIIPKRITGATNACSQKKILTNHIQLIFLNYHTITEGKVGSCFYRNFFTQPGVYKKPGKALVQFSQWLTY